MSVVLVLGFMLVCPLPPQVSVVLVLGFMLAWVPYAAVSLLGTFAGHRVTGPAAVAVVTLLTKNSGWYNPAIYVLFSKQYR